MRVEGLVPADFLTRCTDKLPSGEEGVLQANNSHVQDITLS